MDHDHSYKQLFSHPEMVRDLLTGFVREAWVEQLDLSSLERVSGSPVRPGDGPPTAHARRVARRSGVPAANG